MEKRNLECILEWLHEKGFKDDIIQAFRENDLDGSAISVALGCNPGPEWLKDVIPSLGFRLKVHQELRTLLNSECTDITDHSFVHPYRLSTSPSPSVSGGSTLLVSDTTPDSDPTPKPKRKRELQPSPIQPSPSVPQLSNSSLPQPFPIPKFRRSTQENLRKRVLLDTDRKYIVQTMATMMMAYIQKPSLAHCSDVAKDLIAEYDFLSDDEGDGGNHSWKWFLYHRCQNINRPSKAEGPSSKKPKRESKTCHLIPPPLHADDADSDARNLSLLETELSRPKHRPESIKQLLRQTFSIRYKAYVESNPPNLIEYLRLYPVLKKTSYATQEFCLLVQQPDVRQRFEDDLLSWCRVVILYCMNTQKASTVLQEETDSYCEDLEYECVVIMSLRCLSVLFSTSKMKKLETDTDTDIPFLLKTVPRGTPPAEAIQEDNHQPHIVRYHDEDDEATQYFVALEDELMLETSNVVSALFLCLVAHYIFNLKYHKKAAEILCFLQEKVAQLPSSSKSVKRTPSVTSHVSGITRTYKESTST